MDERAIMIGLRLLHILAGLLWVGAMVTMVGFVTPAVRASGPAAPKIMIDLMLRRKLRIWLTSAMALTVLSGILMMWRLDVVTHHAWIQTLSGKTFAFGAIAALIAGIAGGAIAGPANKRLAMIGASLGGSPPSAEQRTEMAALEKRAGTAAMATVTFLLIATASMAIARYM